MNFLTVHFQEGYGLDIRKEDVTVLSSGRNGPDIKREHVTVLSPGRNGSEVKRENITVFSPGKYGLAIKFEILNRVEVLNVRLYKLNLIPGGI